MLKSSLLEILRTFNKDELLKFDDFVCSPYFNKKENLIKLYASIRKFAPEFSNGDLSKENIWVVLFPGEKYNYGIMKNLIFDLNRLAVKFMQFEKYNQQKFKSDIDITDQYLDRGLIHLARKKITDSIKEMDKSHPYLEKFYDKFKLEKYGQTLMAIEHDIRIIKDFDFNKLNTNLSSYYYSEFFFANYNSLQIAFLYNYDVDKENLSTVINSYKQFPAKNIITEIFFNTFMTVYEPFEEKYYYELKKLFYDNFKKISRKEKYFINIALINFCKNNSNSGKLFFINERYQYIKIMMEEKLFDHSGKDYIDKYLYMSAVIAACTAGEFDWCTEIIEKNKKYIKEDVREQFVNFAYTHLNFKKKNFEKALDHLSKCSNSFGMDKINIKVYQIFLYYELNYYEELKHLIDNCRHFKKNDKNISEHSKTEFINFINCVSKLSDHRYNLLNKKSDEYILQEIKKTISNETMSGKNWLKEKIAELEIFSKSQTLR